MKIFTGLFLTLVVLFTTQSAAQTTYVSQDFSSSTTVSDYVSSTPNSGQFNSISNTSGSVAISGGQLGFTRTSTSGSGIIARTTDFSPEPLVLKVQFDLTVDSSSLSQTSAATLNIGQGFTTSTAVPTNASIHSKLGINFTGNSGEFSLRNIGSSTSSTVFTGQQTIIWYINNSGGTYTYTAPDGSTETLANDAADVFVGTAKVFNDIAATTGTVPLADFKFVFNGGSGSALGGLRIDNISIISPADAPLPVEMGGLKLGLITNGILLSWETYSEVENAGFEVYRSENSDKAFKKIASYFTHSELVGLGNSATGKKYSFTDNSEFLKPGNSYQYKIVNVDFDGTRTEQEPQSILYSTNQTEAFKSHLKASPNNSKETIILEFSLPQEENVLISMIDVNGKTVQSWTKHYRAGTADFEISTVSFPYGIYYIIVRSESEIFTYPVIIQ
jgi:hypothetical protein